MDSRTLDLFRSEVARQCSFALIAFQDIHDEYGRDINRLAYSIENVLVALVHISRLLFPAPGDTEGLPERGSELRKSLGIPDDSPLSEKMLGTLRNDFEHFDARLTKWVRRHPGATFVDFNVMRKEDIDIPGMIPLRHFDPVSAEISFQDHSVNMVPLFNAVKGLYARAQREERPSS